MNKARLIKGLAAGAIVGAAAAIFMKLSQHPKSAKALKKVAEDVRGRVTDHAMKLGKLTRSAFNQIVETTVAEYKGAKALSESELKQLKEDLKDGWSDLQNVLKHMKK